MKPTFILQPETGPMDVEGYPSPSATPPVIAETLDNVVPQGAPVRTEGQESALWETLDNVSAPIVPPQSKSDRGITPPSQFDPIMPVRVAGPNIDESVRGPVPIEPGAEAYAGVKVPGTIDGSQYAPMFALDQLRNAMGTDRYVFEGQRIRSATPCRLCQHGTETFGTAEMQSATFTGIARRIMCEKFKADVTANVILRCDKFEPSDAKAANFQTLTQIERELRDVFALTPKPVTQWDRASEREELEYTARALERQHYFGLAAKLRSAAEAIGSTPIEEPSLW